MKTEKNASSVLYGEVPKTYVFLIVHRRIDLSKLNQRRCHEFEGDVNQYKSMSNCVRDQFNERAIRVRTFYVVLVVKQYRRTIYLVVQQ